MEQIATVLRLFVKYIFFCRNYKQVTHWSGTILWLPSSATTSWSIRTCTPADCWRYAVASGTKMLAADVSFNQPVFSAQMLDWIKIWGSWSTPLTSCCAPQSFLNYFCFVEGHMQAFPAEPTCRPPIMQPRAMCSPVPCALHYPHDITCSFTAPGPVPMLTCSLLALSLHLGLHARPWTDWG